MSSQRHHLALALALATACASTPTTNPGDATMDNRDASTDAEPMDASDAAADAILPDAGTWEWAQYEMTTGVYARRASWPNSSMLRLNKSTTTYELTTSGGAMWFSFAWTPSPDDEAATDWSTRTP